MSCNRTREFLDSASAVELRSPPESVRSHLDGCHSCATTFEVRALATRSLVSATGNVRADDAFRDRLLRALDEEGAIPALGAADLPAAHAPAGRAAGSGFWRSLFAPSPVWAAVALALVVVSGVNWLRVTGHIAPTGEMPADLGAVIHDVGHDAFLYTRHSQTFELVTESADDVTAWFEGRMPFRVRVPSALGSEYRLQGARLWHTVSRLAALTSYGDAEGNDVLLFLVSGENLADRGGREVRRGDRTYRVGESYRFHVVAWKEDGVVRALVGRLPEERLLDFATTIDR